MSEVRSDVLVVFGATGDLAHKMIFPALYSLVKSGHLSEPVIGVAFDSWTVDQLRERARDGAEPRQLTDGDSENDERAKVSSWAVSGSSRMRPTSLKISRTAGAVASVRTLPITA